MCSPASEDTPPPGETPPAAPLTGRECDVLRLIAAGMTNREIAQTLAIAESTVKTHVEHVIAKLGVPDRVRAAVWASRHGYAEPPAP
jgi:DNA-binding NarL/FixJ family response regulator